MFWSREDVGLIPVRVGGLIWLDPLSSTIASSSRRHFLDVPTISRVSTHNLAAGMAARSSEAVEQFRGSNSATPDDPCPQLNRHSR